VLLSFSSCVLTCASSVCHYAGYLTSACLLAGFLEEKSQLMHDWVKLKSNKLKVFNKQFPMYSQEALLYMLLYVVYVPLYPAVYGSGSQSELTNEATSDVGVILLDTGDSSTSSKLSTLCIPYFCGNRCSE